MKDAVTFANRRSLGDSESTNLNMSALRRIELVQGVAQPAVTFVFHYRFMGTV